MRFRISLRTVLIILTLVGCSFAATLHYYRQYVVPLTPFEWRPFSADQLDTIYETRRPILISIRTPDYGLAPDRRFYMEYESIGEPNLEFRRFVDRHCIELYAFDFDDDRPRGQEVGEIAAGRINEMLHQQNPEIPDDVFVIPPFVLVLPGQRQLITFPEPFPDADDVMAAVLSNGENVSGESYFSGK